MPAADQIAAAMVAPVLRVAPRTMAARLHEAVHVVEDLPKTAAAAWAGDLEPWRVSAIARGSGGVRRSRLVEFEARVFADDVTGLAGSRLGERARRAALRCDREGVATSVDRARAARQVTARPGGPGMTSWRMELPAEVSRRMWAAMDALARDYLVADPRHTVGSARADAMADLVLGQARIETTVEVVVTAAPGGAGWTPSPMPSAARVAVVPATGPMPLRRGHRGGADEADSDVAAMIRGELTAGTARAGELEWVLADQVGRIVAVDDNPHLERDAEGRVWFVEGVEVGSTGGTVLPEELADLLDHPDTRFRVTAGPPGSDDGPPRARRRYRPGARLARRVRHRDVVCRFPGCSTPAAQCQLDHVVRFPEGETVEANLLSLCAAHHGFKHHAGWRLTMTADGVATWRAPNGRTHTTMPGSRRDAAA